MRFTVFHCVLLGFPEFYWIRRYSVVIICLLPGFRFYYLPTFGVGGRHPSKRLAITIALNDELIALSVAKWVSVFFFWVSLIFESLDDSPGGPIGVADCVRRVATLSLIALIARRPIMFIDEMITNKKKRTMKAIAGKGYRLKRLKSASFLYI